jgi:holo-[acyl-carrier protein] synthase
MQAVPRPATSPACRVGVDLAAVADVAGAVESHGDRYLRRVYTDHELASCRTHLGLSHESLAARFAAKEAVLKLLEPVGVRPPWRDIEVRRADNGACRVELHRAARRLAAAQGIEGISLSLSHEAGMAVAVAVCWLPAAPLAAAR